MTIFDLIFTSSIPESVRFRTFSGGHAALLLAVAACIVWGALSVRRLPARQKERALRAGALCIPAIYLVRFVGFALLDCFVEPQMPLADRLPFHLCALNAVVIPTAVLRKNRTLLNYLYAISMPAAIFAMLTPAMSYYGMYSWFSWQVVFFFVDHGMMAGVTVWCVAGGYFRPQIGALPRVAAAFVAYCAFIYPVNLLTGQNYLFLRHPDQGTVMALFARYLGSPGYLLPLAGLAVAVVLLLYLPWLPAQRAAKRGS